MLDIDRRTDPAGSRVAGATWASVALHVGLAIAVLLAARHESAIGEQQAQRREQPQVVWLNQVGDSGGGGSSGNHSNKPAQALQRRGADKRTMPAKRPVALRPATADVPPLPEITIPSVPEASSVRDVAGAISTMAIVDPLSLGPRSGRGSGGGDGPGLDDGMGGNTGGGPRRPGGNTTSPEVIRQVRPNYTNAALQARVRGLVVMDAVVLQDGSVGDVKIVRSLDKRFGLDEEAIKAVKQWRFRPARRAGGPIATLVSVEMMFELR